MANKLLWMLLAILPASVWAQQGAQPNYLDEMAKIDAQIAYLQKQTELKEALKKASVSEGLPRIVSILVDDKGGSAQVVYGSGIVRWLKVGDVLADGVKVLSISNSSVVVSGADNHKFALSFAAPQTGAAANSGGAMPPLPNINIPMPLPPSASPPAATVPQAPTAAPVAQPAPAAK